MPVSEMGLVQYIVKSNRLKKKNSGITFVGGFQLFCKAGTLRFLWLGRFIKHQDKKLHSWCLDKHSHVKKNILVNAADLLSWYISVIANGVINFQLSKPGDGMLQWSHVPPWAILSIAYINNLRPDYDMGNNMSSNTVLVR